MTLSEVIRDWINGPIIQQLKEIKIIMAQNQAQLDAAITSLGAIITNEDSLISQIVTEVTALIAKVQANPSADFTTEVTAIQSLSSTLNNQVTELTASLAAAKPVTGV